MIELLAAISIIAVLAAILFPVLSATQEKARTAACQSNLRQIGIAFQEYVQDWDGGYPNTGNPLLWMGRFWRWPLKPYLSLAAEPLPGDPLHSVGGGPNVLLCPSDPDAEQLYDSTSYAYSMSFYVAPEDLSELKSFGSTVTAPGPTCTTQKECAVAYPSAKVLITEWTSNHEKPNVGWNDPSTAWTGGRNCLFADGHARYLKSMQIQPASDGLPDVNLTVGGIEGKDLE